MIGKQGVFDGVFLTGKDSAGQCDGQSGYGVITLDNIVESVVRMKFAEIRECSKRKLLEEMRGKEQERVKQEIKRLEIELETKRQEQDMLKAETIRVIQGKSALDRDTLAEMMAETKAAVIKAGEDLQKAQAEEKALQEATEKILDLLFEPEDRSYNRGLFEYDAVVDGEYVYSYLDGDIARLIRLHQTLDVDPKDVVVLCFPHQIAFLRGYLGRRVEIRVIDMDTVEEELGPERRNLFER